MSKTKQPEDKKRKRRDDEAADEPQDLKKSKKSKKTKESEHVTMEEAPVIEVKREKKDKKSKKRKPSEEEKGEEAVAQDVAELGEKKPKKSKKSKKSKDEGETVPEKNGAAEAVEEAAALQQDFVPLDDDLPQDVATSEKDKKKSKKDKKAVKAEPVAETNGTDASPQEEQIAEAQEKVSSEKKDKKKSKKGKKASKEVDSEPKAEPVVETNGADAPPQEEPDAEAPKENTTSGKNNRFIVFVGNLPYTATKEQIQTHFAKIPPKEIRLISDKNSGKHKGIAFVEFDGFDKMETCLKKYHHSVFPDAKNKQGRKINIELSAGGGGNTQDRKSKIQAKNEKLQNERQREREKRDELEAKQKARKDKKEAKQKTDKKETAKKEDGVSGSDAPAEEHGTNMHPSRLAMLQRKRY